VPALVAIAILLSVLILTSITRLGITPDPAYWGEPGVPILGWQLALAICAGLAVLLLSNRNTESKTLNAVLAVAIWVVAIVAWLGVPIDVVQNSFYAPIRPPTNQPFPNSDAGYYDSMAQSLIIGYPYQGEIPSRPLYVVLLCSLHALLGERYDLIIAAQTLLLALIPVVLFFLGKALHSGAAGVIAALAAVGREWASLLVSSETRVSNTKLLRSSDAPGHSGMLPLHPNGSDQTPCHASPGYVRVLLLRAQAQSRFQWRFCFGCLCSEPSGRARRLPAAPGIPVARRADDPTLADPQLSCHGAILD
jgi:hypothetical protein